jgi:hypothetical protein
MNHWTLEKTKEYQEMPLELKQELEDYMKMLAAKKTNPKKKKTTNPLSS